MDTVTQDLPLNSDKVFHALAYFIFTFLWFFTLFFKNRDKTRSLKYAAVGSILFGIIIELLQGMLTQYRQADLNDVLANTIGTVIFSIIILSVKKGMLKNKNTLLF